MAQPLPHVAAAAPPVAALMPAALVLHDVHGPEGPAATGFGGHDAHRYKLSRDQFAAVLEAVAATGARPTVALAGMATSDHDGVVLTFDDGGVGAAAHAADMLEARGWRGCFLVVTDRLGERGFLDTTQVRDLHDRGHLVGTHSRSHPIPISALPDPALLGEWADSRARLEDLLGSAVEVGSVPGGYYSRRVGVAAEAAGIRQLFNSEPVRRVVRVGECVVRGRYGIQAGTPPARVTALLRGDPLPRLAEWGWWNLKKLPKRLGGNAWLAFRRRALGGTGSGR